VHVRRFRQGEDWFCKADEIGVGTSVLSGTSTICGRPPAGSGFHSTCTTSKPCTCHRDWLRISQWQA